MRTRTTIALVLCLTAFLACLSLASPAGAQRAARDARVVEQVIAAFNEPDGDRRIELLGALFEDEEANRRFAGSLAFLAERHGRMQLEEIAESGPTWTIASLAGSEEGEFLTLELEYETPGEDGLRSLRFRPGRPAGTTVTVGAEERSAVVEAVAEQLRGGYAIASERQRLADAVAAWDDALFADATSAARFATRLTSELRELQNDKHLGVLDPERGAARIAAFSDEAGQGQGQRSPEDAFGRVEVLDGGVGYLEMRAFDGSPATLALLDEKMAGLADAGTLVIDLRSCPGGDRDMVLALSSYFFAEPTHLTDSVAPWIDGPRQNWTSPAKSSHFADRPLYVLTDGRTASAAESFVFGLERNDRITTVGQRTAGAGHFAEVRRLPHGFVLQLPIGRTYDPDTGEGWEGSGVTPDVEVPAVDALAAALELIRAGEGR